MVNTDAFCQGTPSVFTVSTPFQALCALAAIRQLSISKYLIVAHMPKGQETRNLQLQRFLIENNMKYRIYTPNGISFRYYKMSSLFRRETKFTRLFLANHNDSEGFIRSCCLVSDNSHVVYLDDGVQSISLFKGALLERKSSIELAFQSKLAKRRSLTLMRNFLTIYDGIPNPNFIIKKLDLSNAIKGLAREELGGIVIVGIVLTESCVIYNISKEELINKMDGLFKAIKEEYPNEPIIYIPHGRDTSEYANKLCLKNNAQFLKCESMIEVALLEKGIAPKAIFGYTSSALYNLKQLFPLTRVVNVVYRSDSESKIFQETLSISNYYTSQGIELLEEKI